MEEKKGGVSAEDRAIRTMTIFVIVLCFVVGVCLTLLAEVIKSNETLYPVIFNIGTGLVAAAFITIILEVFWSKQRIAIEHKEQEPYLENIRDFTSKVERLEGRLEAFKQLGLNYCTASRRDSLERFYKYANDAIGKPKGKDNDPECAKCHGDIKLVASSSRGLIGYLDREAQEIQRKWRILVTEYASNFKILLTHPAYAHLRTPAEERSSGDIEMEILKTAIYLHFVAGMNHEQLRLYRGSPTSFLIQIGSHILLNPYPYGKMAMDTLCLEFESESESSYAYQFAGMHFDHTWAFYDQRSKMVDGKPLVIGIDSFDDILKVLTECTFLHNEKLLRLTKAQVEELDVFLKRTLPNKCNKIKTEPESDTPFMTYVKENGFCCKNEADDDEC